MDIVMVRSLHNFIANVIVILINRHHHRQCQCHRLAPSLKLLLLILCRALVEEVRGFVWWYGASTRACLPGIPGSLPRSEGVFGPAPSQSRSPLPRRRYLFVAILNIDQGGLTTNTILPEQFRNCFTCWVLTHELSNPP